jgi:hypothetical protein
VQPALSNTSGRLMLAALHSQTIKWRCRENISSRRHLLLGPALTSDTSIVRKLDLAETKHNERLLGPSRCSKYTQGCGKGRGHCSEGSKQHRGEHGAVVHFYLFICCCYTLGTRRPAPGRCRCSECNWRRAGGVTTISLEHRHTHTNIASSRATFRCKVCCLSCPVY